MKSLVHIFALGSMGLMLSFVTWGQVPILYYDFENNVNRTIFENAVEQAINNGSGSLLRSRTLGINGVNGAGTFNGGSSVGQAISTSGWENNSNDPGILATDYFQFIVNTSGFSGISITFDNQASAAGPALVGITYSTNGSTFYTTSATATGNSAFSSVTFDLSAISAIDNQLSITIRIYASAGDRTGRSAFSSSGTLRIDNLSVRANNIIGSKTLLDHALIGTCIRSGSSFVPTYQNLAIDGSNIVVSLASETKFNGSFLIVNGTLNCGSNIISGTGTFTLSPGATLGIGSAAGIASSDASGNIQVTGTRTFDSGANYIFNGSEAQGTGNGLPSSVNNLTINNPNGVSLSGNVAVNGALSLTNGALSIGANTLTTNGTIPTGSGILVGGTSSNIIIGGSGASTSLPELSLNNFTLNRSNGISLGGNLAVGGTLTLTNGRLTLGSYHLTLGPSASVNGTLSASNMVVATGTGEFRKQFPGPGSFLFPIGDNDGTPEYSPITLDFTSGSFSSAYAAVKVKNMKHPNNPSVSTYLNRYWNVTSSGITSFSCNVKCQYLVTDAVGIEPNLHCGKYDGNWTILNSANTTLKHITGTVSSFSDFTGGEAGALPVELVSFSGNYRNGIVNLAWKTATEANNYGFEVERSTYDASWTTIGFVYGGGTVNVPRHYTFDDNLFASELTNGIFYYRLRQIDRDGSSKYSPLVSVKINGERTFSLNQNYPNPFNRSTIISFSLKESQPVTLIIYNTLGKEVQRLYNSELLSSGVHAVSFEAAGLPMGVYKYKLITTSGEYIRTMILMR